MAPLLHLLSSQELVSTASHHRVNPLRALPDHDELLLTAALLDPGKHDLEAAKTNDNPPPPKPKEECVVPRRQRRGLLSLVVFIPEYHDARDYPVKIKYFIVFIIAFALITGPMGTLIMLPALEDITRSLHTSDSTVNVSVGIYLLALGIFPLWWSLMLERFGRRSVYLTSFVMFFGFSIGTALAPTIGALIGLRVLQGGCSALVQAVGAGTIADLFTPQTRGRAMGYYYLGPLCGPFLAPILGGAVAQGWGWRATQWLLVIFLGCNVLLIIFFLPETLRRADNMALMKALLGAGGQVGDDAVSAVESVKEEVERQQLGVARSGDSVITDDEELLEKVLDRVALRLSQQGYREAEEGDAPTGDPLMPNLSRLTTNRLEYSRRVHEQVAGDHLRRSRLGTLARNLIAPTQASHVTSHQTIATHATTVVVKDAQYYRTLSYDLIVRPLHSLILLTHPPVALVIAYSAILFAVLYFFNMTVSYSYARPPYNFLSVIVGLMYIPNSVTYIIALIIGGRWNDRLLRDYAKKHNGELRPELRILWNVVLACVMFPPACLIFGWCLKYGEHWVTPLIGTSLFGFALMIVIGATVTYLVDSLPGKGATGVALNNLIRQIFAAVATFVVEPAIRGIGQGVLFSILMGILAAASIFLVILKWKGDYFREHLNIAALYGKL